MAFEGGFYEVEKDGKLCQLVYQNLIHRPIPQPQSPTSSVEAAGHNHSRQLRFFCPLQRFPVLKRGKEASDKHHVLPMFWCNNKEFDVDGGCSICRNLKFGIGYYFCDYCDKMFHKECVESPLKIKHPYHPDHSLKLCHKRPFRSSLVIECLCCGRKADHLVYQCTICQVKMHTVCAMKTISFVIDRPKRHDHPLTFFPRQASLTCNVCGLLRKMYPTYVCLRCNFVAHNDCMYSPSIIKISRHNHRISYVSSLRSGKWSCGVCRRSIDVNYGAYHCEKCGDYAVHSRCALRKDVWDGEELEGVLEEDDITQDAAPFDMISEGVILHFLHDHHLKLEVNILYDENKLCQACVLPIFEGHFYSCMECDFILHQACADSPRRIHHALHPHPLTLKASSGYDYGAFRCNACFRQCAGFVYQCPIKECDFDLDVRCASISEPFGYKGHEHPLFLSLDPEEKPTCQVCKSECVKQLNCIKCDFIVCFKCATLPYKARYKHDTHFLTVLWGEEVCEKDWCEVCERNLRDTSTELFYWCNDCCTTLHTKCLFGEDPYLKPGQIFKLRGKEIQVLSKSNLSRPFCDSCKNPCQGKLFRRDNHIMCSWRCASELV